MRKLKRRMRKIWLYFHHNKPFFLFSLWCDTTMIERGNTSWDKRMKSKLIKVEVDKATKKHSKK